MGGSILGIRMLGAADTSLGENGFLLGSMSRDLNSKLSGAGRGVQLEFLTGSVAKLAGIAFDEERSGFVGVETGDAGELHARDENCFVH
jgi:hypothetical protein